MPDDLLKDIDGVNIPGQDQPESEDIPVGNTYFLFIAIDHYYNKHTKDKDNVTNLNNPVRDVNMVLDTLIQYYKMPEVSTKKINEYDHRYKEEGSDLKIYEGDFVKCLFNDEATYDNIIDWIETLVSDGGIGENDSLLIYFSGHGEHKKENNTFYLIPSDGVKDKSRSWLQLSTIYDYFDNYRAKKKCRDLLMILDCCHGGSFQLKPSGPPVQQAFSRCVLTSSGGDEKAMDGKKGKGSPFVNEFTNLLIKNSAPILKIDAIYSDLKNKLDRGGDFPGKVKQTLIFENLPMNENGIGDFKFYLKKKDQPRIDQLTESFLEHLNFQTQKGILTSNFNKKHNAINIITTHGSSFDSQKLLSKVLFKWIFKRGLSYSNGHVYSKIEMSKYSSGNLKDIIFGQFFDKEIQTSDKLLAISKYILDTLQGNHSEKDKKSKHMLIWIAYETGDEKWLEESQRFLIKLKSTFLNELAKIDKANQKDLGRLFIIFSDERKEADINDFEVLNKAFNNEYNLLLTPMITPVNVNHFEDWKATAQEKIVVKIPTLTEKNIFGEDDFSTDVKDFISKICAFCEYSQADKIELYNMLYELKGNLS